MFSKRRVYKLGIFALFASTAFVHGQSTSQTRSNSPYTRYGMGNLYGLNLAPVQSTGGALGATYNDIYSANLNNPASLGRLRFATFEGGFYYKRSRMSEPSTGLTANANDGNLSYFSLAIPITHTWASEKDTLRRAIPVQWGMGFGLLPFNSVGYDVQVRRTLPTIGDVQYSYIGSGSSFRFNWSNGFRYKGFSAGINLGVVSGRNTNNSITEFQDSSYNYAFDEENTNAQRFHGFVWDAGVQYEAKLDDDKNPRVLTVGAYGSSGSTLKTTSTEFFRRYGSIYVADTLVQSADIAGTLRLPAKFGVGISFGKKQEIRRSYYEDKIQRWRVGINYEMEFWNQYENTARPSTMARSFQLALGGEWIPNPNPQTKSSSYFQRVRYRGGIYGGTDPRVLQGTNENLQLRKYGITFGLGLPMEAKDKASFVHLGFEGGYLGHPSLIREYFFQVQLAFSITETGWFVRQRFR